MPFKEMLKSFVVVIILSLLPISSLAGEPVRIGTWKTPQTIQPFFF